MKRCHYLQNTFRLFLAASVIVVSTADASEFVPFGDFPDPDGNPPPNNVVRYDVLVSQNSLFGKNRQFEMLLGKNFLSFPYQENSDASFHANESP